MIENKFGNFLGDDMEKFQSLCWKDFSHVKREKSFSDIGQNSENKEISNF